MCLKCYLFTWDLSLNRPRRSCFRRHALRGAVLHDHSSIFVQISLTDAQEQSDERGAIKCYLDVTLLLRICSSRDQANLLFDQQKNKEHLELCNKELTLNEKNAEALLHKSASLLRLEKPEDAIMCCDRILDGDASFVSDIELSTAYTLNNKGFALSMLGEQGRCEERL